MFVKVTVSQEENPFRIIAFDRKGQYVAQVDDLVFEVAVEKLMTAVLNVLLEHIDPLSLLYKDFPGPQTIELNAQQLFPIALRHARFVKGLTQTALATRLNMPQSSYKKLEQIGVNPTIRTVMKLQEELGENLLWV